jgi:subtilisin family serine protease
MSIARVGACELRPYPFFLGCRGLLLFLLLTYLGSISAPAVAQPPASKIEKSLLELAALAEQGQTLRAQDLASQHHINLEGGYLTVIVEPQEGLSATVDEQALNALGATVEARSSMLLRVRLPLTRLNEIAEHVPGIAFIRRPYRWAELREASPLIQQLSQGLLPTGALLFQSQGFRGQGVKVAIIDAGFSGLYLAVKDRVLSAASIAFTKDYTGKGLLEGGEHGSAVAEIVHEMAPEAQLYLMKIGDEVDLANAVDDAIRMGVQVINHSIGWFDTDFDDGTGVINDIVRRARAHNILWVNAAGNQAQAHWIGRFRDDNHNGWADFGLGQESLALDMPLGGLIDLILVWNDWPVTDQDYDLFLTDAQGKVLASSEDRQTGSQPPREELQYVADQPGVYYAKVRAYRATRPMWLRLFQIESGATFRLPTPHGSITAPADCTCALAVAAVNVEQWESGPQEPFSALGPTFDGRIKPDITGPDGVDNLFFSERLGGFLGTSAAAPHVAGAAALLLSQHPGWSAQQLENALREDAAARRPLSPAVVFGTGELGLILGWPNAERHIEASTTVNPGERLIVSLTLQMPLGSFGGLWLREALPDGFRIHPIDNGGAQFDAHRLEWTLPIADPGHTIQIRYVLEIPSDAAPGLYRLQGLIDGRPVTGDKLVRVGSPLPGANPLRTIEPFLSSAGIVWTLPLEKEQGGVWHLDIFDLSGQLIFSTEAEAGRKLFWPLVNEQGAPTASGVYLYRIAPLLPNGQSAAGVLKKLVVFRR